MATTTNFGWETPDDTDLVKDGALAIRTLGSAIDTSLVDLKGGTTGQVLSKTSNTDMDFSWIANNSGGLTLLSTTTLSGSTTTVSSISGSYKNLLIVAKNIVTSAGDSLRIRFNGDTASNYSFRLLDITGTTVTGNATVQTSVATAATSSNTDFSNKTSLILNVYRYTDTSLIDFTLNGTGYDGSVKSGRHIWGRYGASAAITSVTLFTDGATFSSGTLYIYGVN